jgi:hypothetical protein
MPHQTHRHKAAIGGCVPEKYFDFPEADAADMLFITHNGHMNFSRASRQTKHLHENLFVA